MPGCHHRWRMTNIQFGFVVFERCSHCHNVRTYFSSQDTWDEYREGACTWSIVENAQTFRFDLECTQCGQYEAFDDLLGLSYCPGCLNGCGVEPLRRQYEEQKTWILIAFGFLPEAKTRPIPQQKLDMLTDYFNQRRDVTRSRVKILSCDLITDLSTCRGELIHDVGMLALEPPTERKRLF